MATFTILVKFSSVKRRATILTAPHINYVVVAFLTHGFALRLSTILATTQIPDLQQFQTATICSVFNADVYATCQIIA